MEINYSTIMAAVHSEKNEGIIPEGCALSQPIPEIKSGKLSVNFMVLEKREGVLWPMYKFGIEPLSGEVVFRERYVGVQFSQTACSRGLEMDEFERYESLFNQVLRLYTASDVRACYRETVSNYLQLLFCLIPQHLMLYYNDLSIGFFQFLTAEINAK